MKRYPVIEEIHLPPGAAQPFEVFRQEPFSFFLDSGMNEMSLGRYSFLGSSPFLILKSHNGQIVLAGPEGRQTRKANLFDTLDELLHRYALEPGPYPTPFPGGALGYFSYDLCGLIEKLPRTAVDDLSLPECCIALYDLVITFDHLENRAYIASTGFPEQDEEKRLRIAHQRMKEVKERLLACPHKSPAQPSSSAEESIPAGSHRRSGITLRSNFTRPEYLTAVETAREYIARGDIFQVNLSQRFEAELPVPPYELYRRLKGINPAPFAAYLNFDDVTVICASPERFLKVDGGLVETRPMKGTRPRGKSPAEDEALANELQNSAKDRAENVMIVDLERNDLGRVCRYGTVRVRELWTLEKYATVFHLTSCVEGKLRQEKDRIDLLKACFPGGSITGAPKVRSMEIIDELEPTRRSIYTGSIGYLGFGDTMDLNIVIRTILVKHGHAYLQVGGAVTYDSNPEAEYQETLDKAKALFQALSLSPELAVVT
jgi:para-aminobenzoate synthetase component 1